MKRVSTPIVLVMMALAALSCEKEDAVVGVGDPDPDGPPEVDALVLARNVPPILANGVDDVELVAVVLDETGRGVSDVSVGFSTNHGTIGSTAITDGSGTARATLVGASSAVDLTATVTASTTDESAAAGSRPFVVMGGSTLSPEIAQQARSTRVSGEAIAQATELLDQVQVAMLGVTLSVSADPQVIPADGISVSTVLAQVLETTRNIPLPDQELRFGATSGSITARATTDGTGQATANLSGLESGQTSTVTVFYGPGLSASTDVTFSPLGLSLSPGLTRLPADGRFSTPVVARLINEEGNPVSGARIDFSTTLGAIGSPITTDDRGMAVATLVAADAVGTAVVRARFHDGLTAEVSIDFIEPPVTATLRVSVEPDFLPADGGAEATVRALALDDAGSPMPDGTPVTFGVENGDGTVFPPVVATENGFAEATYVAGRTPGTVVVRASAGGIEGSAPLVQSAATPGLLELSADRSSVLADGLQSAVLTARVTDANGGPVQPGALVSFATNLGTIEDVSPTNAEGDATARLRAEGRGTGTARVTATMGQLRQAIDVRFVSEGGVQIVLVDLESAAISVQGTGDPESSTLVFEFRDAHGIPVDAAHAADLAFAIRPIDGTTDAIVFPTAARTNENGQVSTTVNAGTKSGAVMVNAVAGTVDSHPIRVAIHGGLPDPEHFSISFGKVNIAGMIFDGIRDPVTARVGDIWGNPVPISTVVWFRSEYGLIQGSSGTDDHGEATVDHITAFPRPVDQDGDGLVEVCAQTVGSMGQRIEACGVVMWSGLTICEILSPTVLQVPNAGSATIRYRVRDGNFNPLTEGTVITVTSNVGDLQGETTVTLPDTQNSERFTEFEVVILDDEPGINELRPVTVTVSVVSQNGNETASLTGTIQ